MGFFDAIDNAFGDGTALGAIEGFEEKQYDISEEQKALDKAYKKQISGASKGLGDVMKKRRAFNEQVTTFSAALSNDPSLKDKLKDLGPEGIRKLARSALNTRYAEGGASGSKFRVSELIRQVRRTEKSALDERFKVTEDETQKKDKKEDSTRSGGLFGNFANILSPTGAGQERRRVARENLVKQFPDATEEDIANAIATSGTSAGSTNEFETGTPFSVGVLMNETGRKSYQELIEGKLRVKTQADQVNGQQNPVAEQRGDTVRDVMNSRIGEDDYTRGESDKLLEDADNLYEYLKKRNRQPAITDSEIKSTMIREKIVSIDKYIEFMQKNPNYDPFKTSSVTPSVTPPVTPPVTPRPPKIVKGTVIKPKPRVP